MGGGFGIVRKLGMRGKRRLIFPEVESVAEGRIRVMVGKTKTEETVVEMEAHYLSHPILEKLLSLTGEEYENSLHLANYVIYSHRLTSTQYRRK